MKQRTIRIKNARLILCVVLALCACACIAVLSGCSGSSGSASSASASASASASSESAASASASASSESAAASSASAAASSASAASDKPSKDGFDKSTNSTTEAGGITLQIPQYLGTANDKGHYYAEQGNSVAMLQIRVTDCSDDKYTNKEMQDLYPEIAAEYLKVLTTEMKGKEVGENSLTVAGLPAYQLAYTGEVEGLPLKGISTFVYNDKTYQVVEISFVQTDNTQYDYFSDYEQILDTATV